MPLRTCWSVAAVTVLVRLLFSGTATAHSKPAQLVVVRPLPRPAGAARLVLFEKTGSGWTRTLGPLPAVIGKRGWAWGRSSLFTAPRGPRKREGDLRSPAGLFSLGIVYGFAPQRPTGIRFPYRRIYPDTVAVDDPRSRYYNTVFRSGSLPAHKRDWNSAEQMYRYPRLYRLLITVGHNSPRPRPAAGSAVFIHVWSGPGSYTAGCVALSHANLHRLLRHLRPTAGPLLALLPGTLAPARAASVPAFLERWYRPR